MNRLLLADDSHETSGLVFFEKLKKKKIYVYFKMSSAAVPTIYVLNRKHEKISKFLSEIFQFLEVKFSIYLNRRVFEMHFLLVHILSGPL